MPKNATNNKKGKNVVKGVKKQTQLKAAAEELSDSCSDDSNIDVDIMSDNEEAYNNREDSSNDGFEFFQGVKKVRPDEKKEHHNQLERMRRDHMKNSFGELKDCIYPQDDSSKVSRSRCLEDARIYIRRKEEEIKQNNFQLESLKAENERLTVLIKAKEKALGLNSSCCLKEDWK